ncbi:MAG: enoyl-CoA hydratase-related protein, partial [Thermoanaerobaculia bacterium]|nr:enoyl-CoA hydratase-related protein [Thermoanaerobaculia bacterium]
MATTKDEETEPPKGTEPWPLGRPATLADDVPDRMLALTLHRDRYGAPAEVLTVEEVPVPRLGTGDGHRVLVSILATGPNFNTNFAALGLPVPVFGRTDPATLHIPGSDALGLVVDAGAAVTEVAVGEAVILDSWTGSSIRGYETHDGFHAQFALVDADRALPVPAALRGHAPEQLAALLLTYGTAYRAVVERLGVRPGHSVLIMGGGKGTSFPGAQLAKSLGARVVLVGSNPELADSLIRRGIADSFIDRRQLPAEVFGVLAPDESEEEWRQRTESFRTAVLDANEGRPVDRIFEHTGGRNFPLLASVLADGGALAFFGATGQGVRGEYKETFFYDSQRFVMDARWVWMRQKQVIFRNATPSEIFDEIGLLPGRRGLVWGADDYALEFVRAAQARGANLAVLASRSGDAEGITALAELGVGEDRVIDLDAFDLPEDMPDPLTDEGVPDPAYHEQFMLPARALGRAVWSVFGPRKSPDFIVERPDQNTLHLSTFLLRDFDERDAMPSGFVIVRGGADRSYLGSHMYHATQARETVRLLASGRLEMDREDLEVVGLAELPQLQQKMLDGTMARPKGVALVQADREGRTIADLEEGFLGECVLAADPEAGQFLDLRILEGVGVLTITRPRALNALNEDLVAQLKELIDGIATGEGAKLPSLSGLVIRGAGRAFVAGADVQAFVGKSADELESLANANMAVFTTLENLGMPVVALIDGFALGGGNELAMATHYRLVTERALLGQPEVKLGIIPGYGGMQRLPRLVGPRKALEMAVNGESVGGAEAVRLGLADELHPSSTALRRAFEVARFLRSGDTPVTAPDWDAATEAQREQVDALL